jgi:hypothetical protein
VAWKRLCKFHTQVVSLTEQLEIDPTYKAEIDLCAQYDEECEMRDASSDEPFWKRPLRRK